MLPGAKSVKVADLAASELDAAYEVAGVGDENYPVLAQWDGQRIWAFDRTQAVRMADILTWWANDIDNGLERGEFADDRAVYRAITKGFWGAAERLRKLFPQELRPNAISNRAKQDSAGRNFARRVYREKLAAGRLPKIGRGFSRSERALYATAQLAQGKLWGIKTGEIPGWQKPFWQGASNWVSEESLKIKNPQDWAKAVEAIRRMGELGDIEKFDLDFLQRKHLADISIVVNRMVGDGEIVPLGRGMFRIENR